MDFFKYLIFDPGKEPAMGKELAKEIFIRYFKNLSEKNGICFDAEMCAEIEYAIESIYRDALSEARDQLSAMATAR